MHKFVDRLNGWLTLFFFPKTKDLCCQSLLCTAKTPFQEPNAEQPSPKFET